MRFSAQTVSLKIRTFLTYLAGRTYPVRAFTAVLFFLLVFYSFRVPFYSSGSTLFVQLSRSDFDDYYQASRLLAKGEDPYRAGNIRELLRDNPDLNNPAALQGALKKLQGVGSYIYPPFFAFLLLPISRFDYLPAAFIFQTLSIVSLLGFLFLLLAKKETRNIHFASAALAMAVFFRFLMENASNGNIAFFLILLSGAGLVLSFRKNPGLSAAGGFLIGLAGGVKITPLFLGMVLFAGGRFLAIAGVFLGVVFALGVPSLALGWEKNLDFLTNWYRLVFASYGKVAFVRAWTNNQTFSAAIGKLFVPGSDMAQGSWGLPLIFGRRMPSREELTVLSVIARAGSLFLIVCYSAAGLAVFFRERKKALSDFAGRIQLIRLCEMGMLTSLVTSGVSWYHAYGILFVPVFFRTTLAASGVDLTKREIAGYAGYIFFGLISTALPADTREFLAMYSVFAWICAAIVVEKTWTLIVSSREVKPAA